jgi:ribosome-binding protein aMBF1 (putative translation factor)
MARSRQKVANRNAEPEVKRDKRDELVNKQYAKVPSPLKLLRNGQIDQKSYERIAGKRAAGPPVRPFRDLILALRAERDRQGLSLGDLADRTGMDRSAIHKLEIGLNRNPTYATLARYAAALGVAIDWKLKRSRPNGAKLPRG